MNLTDKKLDRIVKLANSKECIKDCEPQVSFPMTMQKWMGRRWEWARAKVVKREV